MSRYPPLDYRGPRDRSRSPPRFPDRRPSAAPVFDSRPTGPPRNASEAPRGPRSQYDGPRPPLAGTLGPQTTGPRPGYLSLRDAPPLGSTDRGRPFRDRDYDRRDRMPSPRERSPPRNFKDPRDFPPRDLDIGRARRESRDGPPSAGSNFSDNPPFAGPPFRGGIGRGRGRGDFDSFRGGRGGRRVFEEREPFRRERSPPPQRWARDLSREDREPERRDDRRPFDRREDERRPEWPDREREADRSRRDQPPPRLEARQSNDSLANGPAPPPPPQTLPIDPGRLAILEQAGADLSVRRPSIPQNAPPSREARRDVPETPSYLNGRAETMANRYNQRGSSPPTHGPAVPAFTLSFAPPVPPPPGVSNAPPLNANKVPQDNKSAQTPTNEVTPEPPGTFTNHKPEPPVDAPVAPKAPPPAPKAELTEPPPSAPKAPRASNADTSNAIGSRLLGVRSFENLGTPNPPVGAPGAPRVDPFSRPSPTGLMQMSPAPPPRGLPTLIQPISPNVQTTRFGDIAAPTGPRASRISPAQASVSPRPPFASPRSDVGGFQSFAGPPRAQSPPPSAPSGPRNRSYSMSPKVVSSSIPTAPKANRGPPIAPRAGDRGLAAPGRAPDRLGAPPPWAPPSAPRGSQWNQWRRPGVPGFGDKSIPAKRDFAGEVKERQPESSAQGNASQPNSGLAEPAATFRPEEASKPAQPTRNVPSMGASAPRDQAEDKMDVDQDPAQQPKQSTPSGHSAAQSFFGKPVESTEDEPAMSDVLEETVSSSEDEEADAQEDLALFNAKFERQKRALEAQIADLSAREYRATTPLEAIARLARVTVEDVQRLQEQQDMEMDEAPIIASDHLMPPATHSSGTDEGPDLLTPKGEEETAVEVRSSEENSENARRARRPSPEPISLPYLVKDPRPFHESDDYQQNVQRQEDTKTAVAAALQRDAEEEEAADEKSEYQFRDLYHKWREECEDLDRQREQQEKMERQVSAEPGPELDAPALPPFNPMEGRRLHKFSSEYEIEQVLKQSEETARIEQERQDRESKKLQADMEKEARIPDQQNKDRFERHKFIDANRFRDPGKLTLIFSYEPQPDTFTEDEQRIFIAAFKETPKKWGEIASLLPNRTYRDCIHHYYANKWDGRFRDNRTKKLKAGGGRGRGRGGRMAPRGKGSALMADLGRTEEVMTAPSVSDSGRPKRAAAPTTFGERESDAKAALMGPSPAKKPGPASKQDANGEAGPEKAGKRRKGMGEKPGRKAKAQQPLVSLAAAPVASSPNKQFLQGLHSKEDVARAQSLEDASLLASLQSGHHSMLTGDGQVVYQQEGFTPSMPLNDDAGRSKAMAQTPLSKSSASSYWSVPEQTDFAKYIAHFGTDFAAIAAHMGTKTQTMIKNHYQRQIDSGNRPELLGHATEADKRREAGEDMGPPPTPTPIVKRKYDNPQPAAPRPLAPHTDVMDVDEPTPPQRAPPSKHASPPQFQAQPRFTSSAQATPVPAHRVIPSPVPSTVSPAMSQAQPAAPPKPMQHPLGQKLTFMPDINIRPESRPGLQATSSFRLSQEALPRSQPSTPNQVPDPQYIRNLKQEQERALRMQEQQTQQERMEQFQRQSSLHRGSAQGSPANPPLQAPLERKPLVEERAPTPPLNGFQQLPFSRPPFGQSMFGPVTSASLSSSLMGRTAFNRSSPKKEPPRPSSVPKMPQAPPPPTPAPPPEPPKRSNLMSILNADADEPRPPKRESIANASQRVASPAPSAFQSAPTPVPQPNAASSRRETFGHPSIPQSQLQRTPAQSQIQAPTPGPPAVKQEPPPAGTPFAQRQKPDWASHVLGHPSQQQQPPHQSQQAQTTLERDTRPYFSHRAALLGSLNQPTRVNPSPPPHGLGHSRTPSLTAQPSQPPPRDQHNVLQGQQSQHGQRGPVQPLHSNPYAQQPATTPFSQPPPQQAQNHAHHSHNSSLSGFPGFHHRAPSREDNNFRQQQEQQAMARREHDEQERRWQQEREREREREMMGRQREAQFYAQQRQQQQEQERQQQPFARGPPPPPQPLHPPTFNPPGYGQPRMSVGLRGQALRETEAAMREEEQQRRGRDEANRRQYDAALREQEEMEAYRRRQEDVMFRRTPSGGFGHPPPPPPRR